MELAQDHDDALEGITENSRSKRLATVDDVITATLEPVTEAQPRVPFAVLEGKAPPTTLELEEQP